MLGALGTGIMLGALGTALGAAPRAVPLAIPPMACANARAVFMSAPQTSALDDVNIEACYLATARAVIEERLLEEGSEASLADADTVDVTVAAPRPGLYQRCCAIS